MLREIKKKRREIEIRRIQKDHGLEQKDYTRTFSVPFLKGIYATFQVIRVFSQKIPADLLSYDKIHS